MYTLHSGQNKIIMYVENFLLSIFKCSSLQFFVKFIKRPTRDACLCMGELQAPPAPPAPAAPPAPPAPHFVFLITL